ncbi:NAD(P)/FAD-dependent oxidoreductase [bacterium]|nr:NAD(P)/FAD-dependent oxidoreductase [bacterium]
MFAEMIEADYVVVGAGAVGLSFLDVMLDFTNADFVLLDRRQAPGGHWRDAYPFVQLHNVSAQYGVNSRPLGRDAVAAEGPEAGHMERAGLAEIIDYFDGLFAEKILASGRVRWLPGHDYRNDGTALSLADSRTVQLRARRRVVDATFTGTQLPSVAGPGFPVAPGVRCVSPNALPATEVGAAGATVISAGKTAMDCVLHLIDRGVDPDAIAWVRPREPWLLNRAYLQPHEAAFATTVNGFAMEMEAAAAAHSVADFFWRLEAAGIVRRIDARAEPTMFRCAIASDAEIAQLRRVGDVIRRGHVVSLQPGAVTFDEGRVACEHDRLFVHACADGVPRKPARPIFEGERLTLQYVRRCAPVFAAALIARVETLDLGDAEKNQLCQPVPMVDAPRDWLQGHLVEARNRLRWSALPALRAWLGDARLDTYTALISRVMETPTPEQAAAFQRWRSAQSAGYARMAELLATE